MLKHIRVATPEEIETIREKADLMPNRTTVFALDADAGTPDLAVVRECFETNPVVYGSATNDHRRARFLWALEERLLGAGIDRYYAQFDASKEHYISVAKAWGFEQVSPVPEIRMLKVIK